MATLKGQNFRILTLDTATGLYTVIGMATNCTVTLNANTESATTKDDVGLADKPVVVSKNWQVSVESLDVMDMAAILARVKAMTPFTIIWDETKTSDNQTPLSGSVSRGGLAYLSDATFTFNDRENSSKSLQFVGSGQLDGMSITNSVIPSGSYTKGQFVRLFLANSGTGSPDLVIGAAKTLSFHVSVSLENSTTKDTEGDWQLQEPVGLSYDISSSALMRGADVITSTVLAQSLADINLIYENSKPVKYQIANVSGANQRTKGAVIVSGLVVITKLDLNGPNRQNADYTATMNGYGEYTVGA